jgi:hypothetical protein
LTCLDASTQDRFVHDIVVIQGGQVSELHHLRSRDDTIIDAFAPVRREEGQKRTDPFAARVEEVPRDSIHNVFGKTQLPNKTLLNSDQTVVKRFGERFLLAGSKKQ